MARLFYFKNKGTLPLLALTTLGISVKEGEDPIGKFGTGLKYTIAGALRLGEEISIETGGRTYYFTKKDVEVKSKTFQIVVMHELVQGQDDIVRELGFTTDIGKHWEPWMYVRELYSNMRDEGGTHDWLQEKDKVRIPEDETRIVVGGPHLSNAYEHMGQFILQSEPRYKFSELELHHIARAGDLSIYYKGILVGQMDKPVNYIINLQGDTFPLTEDRTINSWWAKRAYSRAILTETTDPVLIEEYLSTREHTTEFDNDDGWEYSDMMVGVLQDMWNSRPAKLNRKFANRALSKFKPDDTVMTFTLSSVEQQKFDRAWGMMQKLGYNAPTDWQFVDPGEDSTFGFVRAGKAYLCKKAFNNGSQFLAQVMMEEYLHLHKQVDDYSRQMQDILFAQIISLGEELHGAL